MKLATAILATILAMTAATPLDLDIDLNRKAEELTEGKRCELSVNWGLRTVPCPGAPVKSRGAGEVFKLICQVPIGSE